MSINWEKLENDLDNIIDSSTVTTDEILAARISSITRMTDEEVVALFPEKGNIKKLTELMKIVNASTDQNTKINNIILNVEKFAGIIITLLKKFI